MSRIGFDARLALRDQAGIGAYIRHLGRALRAELGEHAFRLLVDFRDSEWVEGATSVVGPAHSRLGDLIFAAGLRTMRFDLLHCPDHVIPPGVRARTVLTIHDVSFWAMPDSHSARSWSYYDACRESVRRADAVICVSDFTLSELRRFTEFDAAKAAVIPSGLAPGFSHVDSQMARQVTRRYGLNGPYALVIGTISPRKNLPRLVEGLVRAPSAAGVTLVIAGRPGEGSDRVVGAVASASGRVRFIGSPAQADMPALVSAAEFLAYVSLYEGFGFPVLEAMACGTPCLISAVPPLTDLAGEAAVTVDPTDPEAIAGGIERLLTDSLLRLRLSQAGPPRAAPYTWERAARKTVEVYRGVLG